MEQTFQFGYGEKQITATVRAKRIEVLQAVTPPPLQNLPEAFRLAVEQNAIGSPALRDVLTPADQVTVIISDLTRAWMHQDRICPLLVDYLHDVVGMPYANIVFLVALGTHRPQSEAELRRELERDRRLAEASVEEIDRLNILHATMLAMQRAVLGLGQVPTQVLIDGNRCPALPYPTLAIVKGDATEPSISAASILAKTARDACMRALDAQWPQYGLGAHKGYPTVAHLQALHEHGVADFYRRSFAPVRRLLENAPRPR